MQFNSKQKVRVSCKMRLIFLGDICVNDCFIIPEKTDSLFAKADLVIGNLEGAILLDEEFKTSSNKKILSLYNSQNVLDILKKFNIKAVCLANNHIYDYQIPLERCKERLSLFGIDCFGAGPQLERASQPFTFFKNGISIKIFGFGWDVIGCQPATVKSPGVNPFTPDHAFNTIRLLRRHDPSSFVIFMIHWNYEMELYPQPAHRQLAHDLIKEGVDAIIGMHSHVAQGAEQVFQRFEAEKIERFVCGFNSYFVPIGAFLSGDITLFRELLRQHFDQNAIDVVFRLLLGQAERIDLHVIA